MVYVIQRAKGDGGGYVAPPGSVHSYTRRLEHARRYPTREAAEADLCPENERVVALEDARGS